MPLLLFLFTPTKPSKRAEKIEELRFIFTSPTFIEENFKKEVPKFFIPHLFKEADLCGGEFELRLKNQLNQRAIARQCSRWVKEKVAFKSNKHLDRAIPGIIHLKNTEEEEYTYSNDGLELDHSRSASYPQKGLSHTHSKNGVSLQQSLSGMVQSGMGNQEDLKKRHSKVQDYFESAYKENSPEFIYFITLYNIFNEFLEDISLDNLPNDQIGFKDTLVWSKLHNFQERDAMLPSTNSKNTKAAFWRIA